MIGGRRLRHSAEPDIWGGLLAPKLTTFSDAHAAIDPPHLTILLTIGGCVELQDGDAGLLAIACCQTQIFDRGLAGTVSALVDATAGTKLCVRPRIERSVTIDAVSKVG